jgi:hypothetical protein
MSENITPENTAESGLSSHALLTVLADALRNRSMKVHDLYGRCGTVESNQRILLRSEILRDLSVALSDAVNARAMTPAKDQANEK